MRGYRNVMLMILGISLLAGGQAAAGDMEMLTLQFNNLIKWMISVKTILFTCVAGHTLRQHNRIFTFN